MSAARLLRSLAPALLLGAVALPARAAVTLPDGSTLERVDFERHVMGLFGRMGCNSGSCHGSFQGRGGFRLSLFGYDPAKDFAAVTRDSLGRRLDRVNPDNSLLLLKPTGQTTHGGGRRFAVGSWQYQLLRAWIVEGARWERGSGAIEAVTVSPPEVACSRPGERRHLRATAHFSDGSEEDVTPFCDFRANDDAVAEVSPTGDVLGRQPGDTAVIVAYRGQVVPVRVLVPYAPPPGFRYPDVPAPSYIDREVFAKLRRLNIVPSGLSDDAEFLRRVTIDTTGSLPTPDEVRAFLADTDPKKRQKKIEELLASPLHAALWATKFCDITGNNTDALEQPQDLKIKRSQMWHDWFRKRIAENVPYDEIVRGVLCATSRDGLSPEAWIKQRNAIDEEAYKGFTTAYADRPSLDLFWRTQQPVPPEQWGEKTAAAFLGVRLECAQCHKHPFDRWTQADYRAYGNVFARVALGASQEAKKAVAAENAERKAQAKGKKPQNVLREVFIAPAAKRVLLDPDTNRPLTPRALGGPAIKADKDEDPRVLLFDWMRRPDNPFFARSFVNRVWGHYLGVGLVDPVDNFSLANPPSNERLLDALAHDFVEHGYDIRHIERTILDSRVYQLSSRTNETNRLDRNNYAHSYVRPMMAEAVVDVVDTALGVTEDLGKGGKLGMDAPPGSRAIEIGASRVQNGNLSYVLRIFGRPPRTAACDCERALDPALPQKLYLMSDPVIQNKILTGRLEKLLAANKTDDEIVEEMFLATLCRYPTKQDRAAALAYVADKERRGTEWAIQGSRKTSKRPSKGETKNDRRAAWADCVWALINTREFILNH